MCRTQPLVREKLADSLRNLNVFGLDGYWTGFRPIVQSGSHLSI